LASWPLVLLLQTLRLLEASGCCGPTLLLLLLQQQRQRLLLLVLQLSMLLCQERL
jgi:hypothetical protein